MIPTINNYIDAKQISHNYVLNRIKIKKVKIEESFREAYYIKFWDNLQRDVQNKDDKYPGLKQRIIISKHI